MANLDAEGKMNLFTILKFAPYQMLSPNQVEIVLASQHENEMFDEERINTIPFLRKNLQNTKLEVTIKVVNTIGFKKAFTGEEKFALLAETNPVLNDFRKLLALDIQ